MFPKVKIHILDGGSMPKRETEGAIGYDVRLRAIVSATEMDSENNKLRKSLFDFKRRTLSKSTKDAANIDHIYHEHYAEVEGEVVYRMYPGQSVLVGIGFVTEMEFPMFYWVAPRSGLASKWGITVTNAPGTVDPDYRGEAGVLVYNRNTTTFDLTHKMRIAQIIFQNALFPDLLEVDRYEDLIDSKRGSGGFGSTGLR
jgi:dUTP pyrophosphatase